MKINRYYLMIVSVVSLVLLQYSSFLYATDKCGLNTYIRGPECGQKGYYQNSEAACYGKDIVEISVGECLPANSFSRMSKSYCQKYCDESYAQLRVDEKYFIIELSNTYRDFRLRKLREMGVTIHERYDENRFLVSLNNPEDYDQVLAYVAERSERLDPHSKLSPNLREGLFSPFARQPGFRSRLKVVFYHNISIDEAIDSIESLGLEALEDNFLFGRRLTVDVPIDLNNLNLLSDLENVKAIYQKEWDVVEDNQAAAELMWIHHLYEPPYELTGEGISVAVWDIGIPQVEHPDFQDRLHLGDFVAGHLSSHATSVAGTIGANPDPDRDGSDLSARGIAPQVNLYAYNAQTIAVDPFHEKHLSYQDIDKNIRCDNNSFSEDLPIGSNDFASYNNQSGQWDRLIVNHPELVLVKSAGNFRDDENEDGERNGFLFDGDYYGNIGPLANSKNIITVGALTDQGLSSGSSFGPSKDGRIKPDLVAVGNSLRSLSRAGAYRNTSEGTSNAAAVVSGGVALLQEQYKLIHDGDYPLASLVKALLIQTASDFNISGPDYQVGYGLAYFQGAIDLLRREGGLYYLNSELSHRQKHYYRIVVDEASRELNRDLKVSLVWSDWPGVPNQNQLHDIQNKIRIRIISPEGRITYAWSLDKDNPSHRARNDRPNDTDNAQQVLVSNADIGEWIVEVEGRNIFENLILENGDDFNQVYSLASSHSLIVLEEDDLNLDDPNNENDNGNDDDGDGHPDLIDNCANIINEDQIDLDRDGIGDACDPLIDTDDDGISDEDDNCPTISNADQADFNDDGEGDRCDNSDEDVLPDYRDNCPLVSNIDQLDQDGDGLGDSCDNCAEIPNPDQIDLNQNGFGDLCDDNDEDGIIAIEDNCLDVANPDQNDMDGDGLGDECDRCPVVPNPFQAEEDEGLVCSQISINENHSCFLNTEGKIYCWGLNSFHRGVLGTGNLSDSNFPLLINHLPEDRPEELIFNQLEEELIFTQLSVGYQHSCAVDSNRQIWCWGYVNTDRHYYEPVRLHQQNEIDVLQVSAGFSNICALSIDRDILCWRSGDDIFERPYAIQPRDNNVLFSQIMVGYFDSGCAIDSNKKMWCWNEFGEISEVMPNVSFLQIIGWDYSGFCGLTTGSRTLCWNSDGENLNRILRTNGFMSNLDFTYKQVAVSSYHACGLNNNKEIWCMGDNFYGQLGNNTFNDSNRVIQIDSNPNDLEEPISFKQVATAFGRTCAIDMGESVWCWGSDEGGALGNRDLGSTNQPSRVYPLEDLLPEDVLRTCNPNEEACVSAFLEVSTGYSHTCAIDTDNRVWCWGENISGQLGNGNYESSNIPVPLNLSENDRELSFRSISSGMNHSCGIDTDFQAWCWGKNAHGQLGNDATTNSNVPVRVIQGDLIFESISSAEDHTCALDSDQHLWCWGSNTHGQLSLSEEDVDFSLVPIQGGSFGDDEAKTFLKIDSYYSFSSAIDTENKVWFWGAGFDGNFRFVLNNPDNPNQEISFSQVTAEENFRLNHQGRYGVCMIDVDQKLWCGSNVQFPDDFYLYTHDPLEIGEDLEILDLDSEFLRTCFIDSYQEIWCWGEDHNGYLGNGLLARAPLTKVDHHVRGPDEEPLRFVSLSMRGDHYCALSTESELWCWGYDSHGQLGNLDFQSQRVPSKVYMAE